VHVLVAGMWPRLAAMLPQCLDHALLILPEATSIPVGRHTLDQVLQAEPVRAHAVVVTLPLGVLKRGCVAFSPPLPE
jgi:hypothetical protein